MYYYIVIKCFYEYTHGGIGFGINVLFRGDDFTTTCSHCTIQSFQFSFIMHKVWVRMVVFASIGMNQSIYASSHSIYPQIIFATARSTPTFNSLLRHTFLHVNLYLFIFVQWRALGIIAKQHLEIVLLRDETAHIRNLLDLLFSTKYLSDNHTTGTTNREHLLEVSMKWKYGGGGGGV